MASVDDGNVGGDVEQEVIFLDQRQGIGIEGGDDTAVHAQSALIQALIHGFQRLLLIRVGSPWPRIP
jgi:hypothetical protein